VISSAESLGRYAGDGASEVTRTRDAVDRKPVHQNRDSQNRRRGKAHCGTGLPDSLIPARLEDFVGNKRDPLRRFFIRKRPQRGVGEL
jgi:hypothetical protein